MRDNGSEGWIALVILLVIALAIANGGDPDMADREWYMYR